MNIHVTVLLTLAVLFAGCSEYQVVVSKDPGTGNRKISLELSHNIENWDPFKMHITYGKYSRLIRGAVMDPAEISFTIYAIPTAGIIQKKAAFIIHGDGAQVKDGKSSLSEYSLSNVTVTNRYKTPTNDIAIDFTGPQSFGRESKTDTDSISYRIIEVKARIPRDAEKAVMRGKGLTCLLYTRDTPVIIKVGGDQYEKLKEFFSVGPEKTDGR